MSKAIRYLRYIWNAKTAKEVEHPYGYCCGGCDMTFTNYQARNLHVWKAHPGCAKYRKESFWSWIFDDDNYGYHQCVCQAYDEIKCTECATNFQGPYR